MRLYHEEQFGPLVPVVPYRELDEVIDYVLRSDYGQQLSLFGNDPAQIGRLVDAFANQVGRINVNAQCQRGPDSYPFNGRKNSAEGTLSVHDALRVFSIRTLVATRDTEFSGNEELMWREYPSTPKEPFQVSTKGTYYANQIAQARKEGRYKERIPVLPGVPCYTFWDIGRSDGTAVWVFQPIDHEWRAIRFCEGWGEPYAYFAQWLQQQGLVYHQHFLPHDANHVRQAETREAMKSPKEMLESLLPGHRFEIVPKIGDVNWGIQQTRDIFPMLVFDMTECDKGLVHIENYRKKWNPQLQTWDSRPDKSHGHSEAADALRQLAQAYAGRLINMSLPKTKKARRSNWRIA